MSPFVKFEEDIITAYQNIYGAIKDFNDSLFYFLNKNFTNLLSDILNSYYFENDFNSSLSLDDKGKYKINFRETKSFYPFLEIDYLKDEDLNGNYTINFDSKKIISELKQIDPLYKLIFEESDLIRTLNLKNKHDLKFKEIHIGSDNAFNEFSKIHKIGMYNKNWESYKTYQIFDTLEKDLKKLNKLSFINFDAMKNRTFIIAYNDYQIAGVSCIANYSKFDDQDNKEYFARKNIAYSSYISVSSQFRGKNLGIELMKKTFEYSRKNNKILIRSSSTDEGALYLEKKIDDLMNKNLDLPIITHENEEHFYKLKNLIISINNDSDYSLFYKSLQPLLLTISKLSDNKNNIYSSIDYDYEKDKSLISDINNKIESTIDSFINDYYLQNKKPKKLKLI